MKIVFMGTPEFSLECLKDLILSKHEVLAVFTQPDKPKGRGYKLSASPVNEFAVKNNIKVLQPKSLKEQETIDIIKKLSPQLIVVVAYGKILPEDIINFPEYGCINVHASILPKYRGAAPIQWSIINGEKETGITTMFMNKGLDTGDILLTSKVQIQKNETAGELYDILSKEGSKLLLKTIEEIEKGNILRRKQDDALASYAPILKKEMSWINWNDEAVKIHNLIRGLNPWPIAKTSFKGKALKVYSSKVGDECVCEPGRIISLFPFVVGCKNNTTLKILEVQLEGKKRMLSEEFFKGHRVELGTKLGE